MRFLYFKQLICENTNTDTNTKPKDVQIFRFTKNQRNKKSRRLRYLRNQLKPDCIKSAELQLSKVPSATLDIEHFVQYSEARRIVGKSLCKYYSNETEKGPCSYYPDSFDFEIDGGSLYYGKRLLFITRVPSERCPSSDNISAYLQYLTLLLSVDHLSQRLTKEDVDSLNLIIKNLSIWLDNEQPSEAELESKKVKVKRETHEIISKLLLLPFRKLKLASKIYCDKCDEWLVKCLQSSFRKNAVLIAGDWSAPNARFHEPTRNKGLLRYLKKSGFPVYMVDEYNTSSCCPECFTIGLEKFKEVQNPRPFQRKKNLAVLCHGLLRCKNRSCLDNDRRRVFNRDTLAVLNFRYILQSLREDGQRPRRFERATKKRENGEEGPSRPRKSRKKQ